MKVFLSSPWLDLSEYREAAIRAIERHGDCVKGMEFFTGSERPLLENCLEQLRECRLVICLLGVRYGTIPSGKTQSYTHLEIEHALEHGIPVVPFIMHDDVPVLAKHQPTDAERAALGSLKTILEERGTPRRFKSPDDLRAEISDYFFYRPYSTQELAYRETAYDAIADWYDAWYKNHWKQDYPFVPIRDLVRRFYADAKGNLLDMKILDCACGTGNTYISFRQAKFDVQGTDGSHAMLARAAKNCRTAVVDASQLISEPINWTDRSAYLRHFEPASFDLIVNTANSFCHLPPIKGFMDVALENFFHLLKPGGLLFIDTKKYIRDGNVGNVPLYREQRYVEEEGQWEVRTDRPTTEDVEGIGKVTFHTRLHYDLDPAFSEPVSRALIVLTIYGDALSPRTHLIPYYPLPRSNLEQFMKQAGFKTCVYDAFSSDISKWKYDVVVGIKPKT